MKFNQVQPMKGRRPTTIEIEATGSICKLQDELHEAREIIRELLIGVPPPGSYKKWVRAHRRATEFLKGEKRELK